MSLFYWNADSPFCRIALWNIYNLEKKNAVELLHLSWEELRKVAPGTSLGDSGTVPCLLLPSGQKLSDSLRILAYWQQEHFASWFLSLEGEHYRMVEGQFSRIMYALYDGAQGKTLDRVRSQWRRALQAVECARKQTTSTNALWMPAFQVFVTFCLALQPRWREDIQEPLVQLIKQQETAASFAMLRAAIAEVTHQIPCSWDQGAPAGGVDG